MTGKEFQHIASSIPSLPGIYKFYDRENELLYIGKAKNLNKRVRSYFTKNQTSHKTHELVNRIHHIEFTIVDSEQDAFFLENSLIKKFQPRFNISLKDDKSYPYIVIKNEPFPRVFLTRRLLPDTSEYLGPYTSVHQVSELLNFIKQSIPLRTCTLNLSTKNIEKKKFKVCLEYHLGNCKGPCEGLQSAEEYQAGLQQVRNLLKGNLSPVIMHFREEMKRLSEKLEFEKAEAIKKKIEFLKNYRSRSVISNPKLSDLDVFYIEKNKEKACVCCLMVRSGTIVQTKTTFIETPLDEPESEMFISVIGQMRNLFKSTAKELVVPIPLSYPEENIKITVPKAGDKKKLLDLAAKNASYYIEEWQRKKHWKPESATKDKLSVLNELQRLLKLPQLPVHIECFDNSNFQGAYPVSAMVCFKNGLPSKKDYRLFTVKSVVGINDFATMREAVNRRYKNILEEQLPWPQLVIIDGGKGQLSAAIAALKDLNAAHRTTLIGLAKNEEEIFFAGDRESLKLPFDNPALNLLRSIRDEVHRFGINFHRKKRSKGTFKNQLEEIKGIGKESSRLLLNEFRSVKKIKEKTIEELAKVVGEKKAKKVYEALKK